MTKRDDQVLHTNNTANHDDCKYDIHPEGTKRIRSTRFLPLVLIILNFNVHLHQREIMGPFPNSNHVEEVPIEDTIVSLERSRIDVKSTLKKQEEVAALCKQHALTTQSYGVSIRDSIESLERVRAALQRQEKEIVAVLTSLDNHLSLASSILWSLNCRFSSFLCGQGKGNNNLQPENNDHDLELARPFYSLVTSPNTHIDCRNFEGAILM